MIERSNVHWFFWLAVTFVLIGIAITIETVVHGAKRFALALPWLADLLMVGCGSLVIVLVAYATSEWALRHAAVVMLVVCAGVIVGGIRYLEWRNRADDTPAQVAAKIGALSDGQAFERDEAARQAMRQRLASFSGSQRGGPRLERVK